MCRADRVTTSRGRAAVPATFLRTLLCRRRRAKRRSEEASFVAARAAATELASPDPMLLPRLPDLAAHDLTLVAHALALVRLRRADLPDVRGDLAHSLFVDPGNREPGGRLHRAGDARRGGNGGRVAEPEGALEVAPAGLDAVTGADDLERLRVACRAPLHHVRDQRPRQAVQRPAAALVVRPQQVQRAVLAALDGDRFAKRVRERSLRPGDRDRAAIDRHLDPAGDRDGQPSDSRHVRRLLTTRKRGLPRPLRAWRTVCP